MKFWKCADCRNTKFTDDTIIASQCGCGGYYILISIIKKEAMVNGTGDTKV